MPANPEIIPSYVMEFYRRFQSERAKFGTYHKCLFHVHTPQSHDYRLFSIESGHLPYGDISFEELFEIALEEYPELKQLYSSKAEVSFDELVFSSKKEFMAFLVLAVKILRENIEIIVVADHNTIDGCAKLSESIRIAKTVNRESVYPEVIWGIEISCADRNHVVGIVNRKNEKSVANLKSWLSENLMSVEYGSYFTGCDILDYFEKNDIIGYIAHIDTSDTFRDDAFSFAYKKRLFTRKGKCIVGLRNRDKAGDVLNRILNYSQNQECCFVLDNDSHDISDISNNTVWVKGDKREFHMIREAIRDDDIAISFFAPSKPCQYIKGLVVFPGADGFLRSKTGVGVNSDEVFKLSFSDSLNCFIGGRGTGKSTVLNILDFALGGTIQSKLTIEMLCKHNDVWVFYHMDENDYAIHFTSPVFDNPDDNIERFLQRRIMAKTKGFIYTEERYMCEELQDSFVDIFLINDRASGGMHEKVNKSEKRLLLNRMHRKAYSINNLIEIAGSKSLTSFIKELIRDTESIRSTLALGKQPKGSSIQQEIERIVERVSYRRQSINDLLSKYNDHQNNKLRIVYKQNMDVVREGDVRELFDLYSDDENFGRIGIKNIGVLDLIMTIIMSKGFFDAIMHIVKRDTTCMDGIDVSDYFNGNSEIMLKSGSANPKDVKDVIISKLRDRLVRGSGSALRKAFDLFLSEYEFFDLEFNLNHNEEGCDLPCLFKPIGQLSLGQKVVAMISFILSYSEYSKDFTPLIIDQPEDSLDNQYIYQNLVNDLRKVKEKRQVIVATHSSTIVTNAKAEQVIVMCSDNRSGWIDVTGYPTQNRIVKKIINYMEGGVMSFRHKSQVYREVIKS